MYTKGDKVSVRFTMGRVQKTPGISVMVGDVLTVIEEFVLRGQPVVVFEAKGLSTNVTSNDLVLQDANAIWSEDVKLFSKAAYPFKKGDRVKVKKVDDYFYMGPDGKTCLREGDILSVLETGTTGIGRIIIVYASPGVACTPGYDCSISIPDSQCIYADNVELVNENVSVASCICSRTTLLREGCKCGGVKKYKVS